MKITYTRVGDYYLPNLAAPESPKVGRWGMLRFNYLRKHREALYTIMFMEETLNPHLEEIDRQAQEMEQQLISQLAQREGVEMPICHCVYEVLYHGKPARDVVGELMNRSRKEESGRGWQYPN